MGEESTVDHVDLPTTLTQLRSDLRSIGLSEGDTVIVHSALSSLGWVCGATPTVVDALMKTVTETGNIVMPAFSNDYADPSTWEHQSIPEAWVEIIRNEMPPYRPEVTPVTDMGAIPECFRQYPKANRSQHPMSSFVAWGKESQYIVENHSYSYRLGENSPLARVYDLDGKVLLLGVGFDRNTSLHLAEHRADIDKNTEYQRSPVLQNGERTVVEYEDIEGDGSDFSELERDFERDVETSLGKIGDAESKLMSQVTLVDYAVEWFEANRGNDSK